MINLINSQKVRCVFMNITGIVEHRDRFPESFIGTGDGSCPFGDIQHQLPSSGVLSFHLFFVIVKLMVIHLLRFEYKLAKVAK